MTSRRPGHRFNRGREQAPDAGGGSPPPPETFHVLDDLGSAGTPGAVATDDLGSGGTPNAEITNP